MWTLFSSSRKLQYSLLSKVLEKTKFWAQNEVFQVQGKIYAGKSYFFCKVAAAQRLKIKSNKF